MSVSPPVSPIGGSMENSFPAKDPVVVEVKRGGRVWRCIKTTMTRIFRVFAKAIQAIIRLFRPNILGGMRNAGNTCYLSSVLRAFDCLPAFRWNMLGRSEAEKVWLDRRPAESDEAFQARQEAYDAIPGDLRGMLEKTDKKQTVSADEMNRFRQLLGQAGMQCLEGHLWEQMDAGDLTAFLLGRFGHLPFEVVSPDRERDSFSILSVPVSRVAFSESPPELLPIQLGRFDSSGNKLSTAVTVPEFIEVPVDGEQDSRVLYRLCSVVCHGGRSVAKGHYVAYGKKIVDDTPTWVVFNDASVRRAGDFEAVQRKIARSAYLCFYALARD